MISYKKTKNEVIDAIFESVSGFSTTGSSVVIKIEELLIVYYFGEASLSGLVKWEFWYYFY